MTPEAIVIVHWPANGDLPTYHVIGGELVQLFIVDEKTPNDRVYEWLPRDDVSKFREIIPHGTEIGSNQDSRHAAVEAKVIAFAEGRKHLTIVTPDGGDAA